MKYIMPFVLAIAVTTFSSAQDVLRKIEVSGTATINVEPDIFEFRIVLREYMDKNKKVSLDAIEKELLRALNNVNLPDSALRVENIFGHNWNDKKNTTGDFMAQKSFLLSLDDTKILNNLLEQLDEKAVMSVNISQATSSKITEYRNLARISALKNAKEKAENLLTALDEQLGKVLEIQDLSYEDDRPVAKMAMMESEEYQSSIEYKMISIKSNIRAVFEIK